MADWMVLALPTLIFAVVVGVLIGIVAYTVTRSDRHD